MLATSISQPAAQQLNSLLHNNLITAQPNAALDKLNTLGFAATADWLVTLAEPQAIPAVLEFAQTQQLPVFPLGGGSNVILAQQLHALVLRQQALPLDWSQAEATPGNFIQLEVPAGYSWHQLVMQTTQRGYFGLENLALIPGQAGAAPIQNIGAYGVELADSLQAVTGYWLPSQGQPAKLDTLAAADCQFGYRTSRFKTTWKGRFIITALHLQLARQAEPRLNYADLHQRIQAQLALPGNAKLPLAQLIATTICELRRAKLPDPKLLGNAGSFFKNPVVSQALAQQLLQAYPQLPVYPAGNQQCKIAAGWLIENCGFKGYTQGSLGVYPQQALVLTHSGGSTATDLLAFAAQISAAVARKFQVQLEIEPELVQV